MGSRFEKSSVQSETTAKEVTSRFLYDEQVEAALHEVSEMLMALLARDALDRLLFILRGLQQRNTES